MTDDTPFGGFRRFSRDFRYGRFPPPLVVLNELAEGLE